jgi:hypothetical protein
MVVFKCFALFLALLCAPASAQEKPNLSHRPDVQKGQVVASVHSVAKPEQSYAIYVPTNYLPERRWPIIYVFDPGAKGSRPLELMKQAAETYGYILAGSNNSRNGPWEIEREAAQEMWNDTHHWLSIDDRRVYFAGFSGGARLSAQLAQMCNCAHGVFLNGAGLPSNVPPSRKLEFSVFATAGMSDFNYGELTELDAQLESLGLRHFFQRFDGVHSWAPAAVWQQALAWSALLEMKDKLREGDQNFVSAELARATERLRKREEAGELYFAWGETRSVLAVFDGLIDTSALRLRLAALADKPAVRAGGKQEKADIEKQHALEAAVFRIIPSLRDAGGDRTSLLMEATTGIGQLRDDLRRERRPEPRRVLERALGGIFITAMETGRPILETGDGRTAALYFELGAAALPDSAWPHFSLAKCHALAGDKKAALRDLKQARAAGSTAAEVNDFVKADAKLAALMKSPEYQKLVGGTSP